MNEWIDRWTVGRLDGWMYGERNECAFLVFRSRLLLIKFTWAANSFVYNNNWIYSINWMSWFTQLHDKLFGSLKFNSFEKYLSSLDWIHGKSLIRMWSSNDSQKKKKIISLHGIFFLSSFCTTHFLRLQ